MKKIVTFLFTIPLTMGAGVSLAAAHHLSTTQDQPVSLKTTHEKLGYSIGLTTGRAYRSHSVNFNVDAYIAGFKDGYQGQPQKLTNAQIQKTLSDYSKKSIAKLQAQMAKQAKVNAAAGTAFLKKNKSMPDVKTLASGLQYKIITPGKGKSPTTKDSVTVNYEGRLLNGKVFDSSYKRGKPVTFPIGNVIKGWQQALVLMKPGATWEIYVPSDLAYGQRGAPQVIGPNETLIFKINLISVKPAK